MGCVHMERSATHGLQTGTQIVTAYEDKHQESAPSNGCFVVKTFGNRALWRKDLRQQLANLG